MSIEHLLGKVHNCDCLEFMKQLPDKCVDLVVTSPPYNLGDNHHTGNNKTQAYSDNLDEGKYQDLQIQILDQLGRITNQNGSVFYNHKNRIRSGLTISPMEWILKSGWKIRQEITWFNGGQNFDKCRFYPMTEKIYWLSKHGGDIGFNNAIGANDLVHWEPEGASGKEHTRGFPLKYPISVLNCFEKAQTIFDPFMGSGTTAVACERLGRKWFGCELEPKYCAIANKRIEAERAQLKLF